MARREPRKPTKPTIEQLWKLLHEQQREVEWLKAQLRERQPGMARLVEVSGRKDRNDRRLSRSGLLKAAAAGIAGVAGAGALSVRSAGTASAYTADTNFVATGIGGGGTGFSAPSSANFQTGVEGYSNNGYGVAGTGYIGVYGFSFGHLGVWGVHGQGASVSAPSSGVVGESDSTPGIAGYSDNSEGMYGHSHTWDGVVGETDTSVHAGVAGHNNNGGTGTYGYSNSGYGLQGESGSGPGVYGYSTNSDGIHGNSFWGYGGVFERGIAHLQLAIADGDYPGPPGTLQTGHSYQRGALYIDGDAVLYHCVASGNPGTWVPMISLVPFSGPNRVFGDGATTAAGTTTAAIDATASSGVPAGARAAYCAVQATNPGVMTLFPDGASDPGIANWSNTGAAGQLALVYMLVPLSSAGKFKIHTYLTGQIYVDVWGYLM